MVWPIKAAGTIVAKGSPLSVLAASGAGLVAITALLSVGCGQSSSESAVEPTASFVASEPAARTPPESAPFQIDESHYRGTTRFELTNPAETGLDFEHAWNPSPDQVDRLNSYAIGVGVAIGDFDGDGLADVFLSSQTDGGKLFRNLGSFHFEDVTAKSGLAPALEGMWATGCTAVDIDGDNDLDLYVCGYDTENRLFVNDGDGKFRERAASFGLDFRGASVTMAFSDYDGDGDLDGYLLTNHLRPKSEDTFQVAWIGNKPSVPEKFRQSRDILIPPAGQGAPKLIEAAQYDILYRNDGNGHFEDVTEAAGIGRHNFHGLSATWWDCNSDGCPDIYVANDFFGPDHLYVNNRDGTFTDRVNDYMPHVPWFSMGADSADLNNDGLFDFMASDMSSTSAERAHVTMSDLATDAWFLDYAVPRQYMRNALYINSGENHFLEAAQLAGVASTNWTWTVKFADFDGDGWVDLFVSNGMTRDFQNADLKQASREAKNAAKSPHEFWQRQAPLKEANLVYRNNRDLRFQEVGPDWGLDHSGVSLGAAYGDLDNDGDLDLVVNNFEEPASVYRNHTEGQHYVKIRLRGDEGNPYGIDSIVQIATEGGKQSRYVTLSRGFMSSDEPVVHFGIGQATQLDSLEVRWRDGSVQKFVDLPADRSYVVTKRDDRRRDKSPKPSPKMFVEVSNSSPIQHEERSFDDFSQQPLLPGKLSQRGPGMAFGDVNGDGLDDLYVGGGAGQQGQLFLASAAGFRPVRMFADAVQIFDLPSHEAEELGAVFFDIDGDDDLDLYVVSGGVEREPDAPTLQDHLLLNEGSGKFVPAPPETIPAIRNSGSCVGACDFDRDGDVDLFVGGASIPGSYPEPAASSLLVNRGGRLTDETSATAPDLARLGIVTSALWSDVDNDGWIDLLVAQEWGPIQLFRNEEGRLVDRTEESGIAQLLGWWNGIAGRDFDKDGDIDYVVTNCGLNTRYQPTPDSPAILFSSDFDGSGQKHLVEAVERDSALYPVRGRQAFEMALPIVAAKFPTFADFASAKLTDLFDSESIAEAKRLEANTLESGVLLNDGSGKFHFQPLPRLAQIAPSYGVAATDCNADGVCDLLLAQNFYGSQRETGRMNGGVGLLLLGVGDGTFQPVWPNESGIVVPADCKSLLVADTNGDRWADFAFGVNDGDARFFENRGASSGKPLVVRLVGAPGNPTAIGARVSVITEDGEMQTAEVVAGGSYLSQSSGSLFFGATEKQRFTGIHVRWPDGSERTYQPGNDSTITIEYNSKGGRD